MNEEKPGAPGGFEDEVSRMLHARALRHPDHTDPLGITAKHLKAIKRRRRSVVGTTATLAVTGGAVLGLYSHSHGGGADRPVVSAAADYSAAPTCAAAAKVSVEIPRGATAASIAHTLFETDVIKSERAYLNAVSEHRGPVDITVGTYEVCPRISAANAILELSKMSNLSAASSIIVTPHESSKDVIASLIAKRKWKQTDFDAAIAANTIGLPAWSVDSVGHAFTVEGMLEPGMYSITSSDTPRSLLTKMVGNRMAFLKEAGFEAKAASLTCGPAKCTPEQALTVASIAEAEVASPDDGAKVSEGVYRRLATHSYLGLDTTGAYYLGKLPVGQRPTARQVQDPNNPYSTYPPHLGLPPTPINIPSDDMIKAAVSPTNEGAYYWCVSVSGTTFFKISQAAAFAKACR